MKRAARLAGLSLAPFVAAGWAAPASASDPVLVEKIAPGIARACREHPAQGAPFGATGVISAKDVHAALSGSEELDFKMTAALGLAPRPFEVIARETFDHQGDNPNALRYGRLRRLITGWATGDESAGAPLRLSDGGVVVTRSDGSSAAGEGPEILSAILFDQDSGYVFHCIAPTSPTPEPPRVTPDSRRLQVGRTPADLGQDLAAKKFAEIAFLDDIDADSQSYSIFGTIGLNWRDPAGVNTGFGRLIPVYTLFGQIERQGSADTADADEINNLSIGGQVSGFLYAGQPTRVHMVSLSGRYLTDDSLESEVWSVTGRFTPGLDLPGYLAYSPLFDPRLQWRWTATAVADWIEVEDPGGKTKLQGSPSFGRIGYDLAADLRWSLDEQASIILSGSHAQREDLTDGGGDAEQRTARLSWSPSPNYAFSIVWERGDNLDTLEENEQIKITLGYRR